MKTENHAAPAVMASAALALTACIQTSCSDRAPRRDESKPNVIIILADDLGYGDLECYGAKNVRTPEVNALAAGGIRFTGAHATASTSTPSRYSLLTGEYAWRKPGTDIAAGNAAMIISPGQFTLADMFSSAGYSTAAFGKWHLGLGDVTGGQDWNAPLASGLGDLGFGYSYIMAATADRVPCVFIENGRVCGLDPSDPIEVSYKSNFEGEPTGRDNPELLYNLRHSHGHDMSIVNGIGRIGFMKGGQAARWKDENIADSITVHAVDYIRAHASEPFFIYFATNDVHVPRFPHERFRGASGMGLRGDAIAEFDWSVGRLVDALREEGILDNTLIVLTSDNGPVIDDGYDDRAEELLNGHDPNGGLRGGKYSAFEAGTAVPFIVSWPARVAGGAVTDVLASQIDLFASLASLVGAKLPRGAAADSRDCLTTLLGENTDDVDYVIEMACDHTLSIRNREWKYIEPSSGPAMVEWGPKIETGYSSEPQLYHVATDPAERVNVAAGHPDIVAAFRRILLKQGAGHQKSPTEAGL